ncbi:hypothetical protein GCM10010191_52080 [Actinomadura vinacea]|uniref:Orc1-like AAA ATPase domain-containing protein n=1 Tax=Actinomadura vinacea TaxID=115336 RepID=A0ABP5WNL2_9ACTN
MTAESIELPALYFGHDDAENDITEGGLLRAGFLRTAAYEAARRSRRRLIVGRKGTGKSAICRTLAAEENRSLVTALVTPDELSADELRRFELQGIAGELAKAQLWRYVLAVRVAQYLVEHAEQMHGKPSAAVRDLRDFLVANGELEENRPKFWQIVRRLKTSLSLEAFGVKVGMDAAGADQGAPSEGIRAAGQLDLVEKRIRRVIDELGCPADHPRLLIMVDQVEDVWSNDGASDSLVIGLLRAARNVAHVFPGVSCVVFLRSDIYDLLQFSDKDKYRGTEMRLDWTPAQLLDLALTRAQASLGEPVDADRLWARIFPATVGGVPIEEYIVSRTLRRPRDIIHLCNLCCDVAERNGHDRITAADVAEATAQYSRWKLEDLANEYLVNYPFLGSLFGLFKDAGYMITRAAFHERWERAAGTLAESLPGHSGSLSADAVLNVLYEIGFLGVRRNDRILYAYEESRIELSDHEFHIHPAFRHALRATGAITPQPHDATMQVNVAAGRDAVNMHVERGSMQTRLGRSARRGLERLTLDLDDARLPYSERDEVYDELKRMSRLVQEAANGYATADLIEVVLRVADDLLAMSERLEADGFTEAARGRFYVRSIEDVGRRLRAEARGTSRPTG